VNTSGQADYIRELDTLSRLPLSIVDSLLESLSTATQGHIDRPCLSSLYELIHPLEASEMAGRPPYLICYTGTTLPQNVRGDLGRWRGAFINDPERRCHFPRAGTLSPLWVNGSDTSTKGTVIHPTDAVLEMWMAPGRPPF
jgi:hypothetical protein